MPAAIAPPYGAQAYWDDRFRKETGFEWLLPPESLTAPVREAMDRSAEASAVKAKVSAYASAHGKDHHHHHNGSSSSSNGSGATSTPPKPKRPPPQRLLHIGCGSSNLSFHLGRALVADPSQVTNVDYSRVAIEKCRRREDEMMQQQQQRPRVKQEDKENGNGEVSKGSNRRMKWKEIDLLSVIDMAALARETDGGFDIIVDKSTTDCMACADDVEVELPLDFFPSSSGATRVAANTSSSSSSSSAVGGGHASGGSIGKKTSTATSTSTTASSCGNSSATAVNGSSSSSSSNAPAQPHTSRCKVHPLHLIAVQLAAVARPGVTRWVCVSYSEDRFPFLSTTWDDDPQSTSPVSMLDRNALEKGLPDPSTLWRVERREAIRRPQPKDDHHHHKDHHKPQNGGPVHRPDVVHWLYILVRTEVHL
jgi:hypothetical protein